MRSNFWANGLIVLAGTNDKLDERSEPAARAYRISRRTCHPIPNRNRELQIHEAGQQTPPPQALLWGVCAVQGLLRPPLHIGYARGPLQY